jgi:hypothetical protein
VRAGEALNGFVDRSVAACNDHIDASVFSGVRRDRGSVAGRSSEF